MQISLRQCKILVWVVALVATQLAKYSKWFVENCYFRVLLDHFEGLLTVERISIAQLVEVKDQAKINDETIFNKKSTLTSLI